MSKCPQLGALILFINSHEHQSDNTGTSKKIQILDKERTSPVKKGGHSCHLHLPSHIHISSSGKEIVTSQHSSPTPISLY